MGYFNHKLPRHICLVDAKSPEHGLQIFTYRQYQCLLVSQEIVYSALGNTSCWKKYAAVQRSQSFGSMTINYFYTAKFLQVYDPHALWESSFTLVHSQSLPTSVWPTLWESSYECIWPTLWVVSLRNTLESGNFCLTSPQYTIGSRILLTDNWKVTMIGPIGWHLRPMRKCQPMHVIDQNSCQKDKHSVHKWSSTLVRWWYSSSKGVTQL